MRGRLVTAMAYMTSAAGCYLQPTVFDGAATTPPVAYAPAPVVDEPVGCVTHERAIRRVRSGIWWLGDRRVGADAVDRALRGFPPSATQAARARRDQRLALALFFAGAATTLGSLAALLAWSEHDPQSRTPLVMLAPELGGFAVGFASVGLSIRGDHARRRAVDTFNDAAAREDRCPP